jgi:hypothetical protein
MGAHGTGLRRVKGFAREANGQLLLRSASARGTAIVLILPTVATVDIPRTAAMRRPSPRAEETSNEARQPITA